MNAVLTNPESFIGRTIGGVELVRVLRLTPTGALFAGRVAEAPVATRTVALTCITWPATPAARMAYRAAFLYAAQAISQVQHPHLAPIERFGDDDGVLYAVSPWFVGRSLADRLMAGPLTRDQTAVLAEQIGGALEALHARGIIHGNITPEAIVMDDAGNWLLSDMRLLVAPLAPTPEAAVYQAPEVLRGERVMPTADLFGLSVVLHQARADKLPAAPAIPAAQPQPEQVVALPALPSAPLAPVRPASLRRVLSMCATVVVVVAALAVLLFDTNGVSAQTRARLRTPSVSKITATSTTTPPTATPQPTAPTPSTLGAAFTSPDGLYSLHYPANWVSQAFNKAPIVNGVIMSSPDATNFLIVMPTTVDLAATPGMDYLKYFLKGFGGQNVVDTVTKSITLNANQWMESDGTFTRNGIPFDAAAFSLNHDGHFFLVIALAPQATWEAANTSTFQPMIASLTFLK